MSSSEETRSNKPLYVLLRKQVLKRSLRALLVSVNVVVSLLCLAVFVTGLWGQLYEDNYVGITDNPSLKRTAMAVAVAGLCALLLSLLGIVGALLLKSILGQVVLSVYAFVLVFLIVVEIAAGTAAITSRNDLRHRITKDTISFLQNGYNESASERNEWDRFQLHHKCCGANNYTDYFEIFNDTEVPRSCCTAKARRDGKCSLDTIFVTPGNEGDIYTQPCLDIVILKLQGVMLVLAVVAIAIGTSQIAGVIMSTVMIFAKERKTHSYQKLKHQPGSHGHYST